jgi:hypothetical protein
MIVMGCLAVAFAANFVFFVCAAVLQSIITPLSYHYWYPDHMAHEMLERYSLIIYWYLCLFAAVLIIAIILIIRRNSIYQVRMAFVGLIAAYLGTVPTPIYEAIRNAWYFSKINEFNRYPEISRIAICYGLIAAGGIVTYLSLVASLVVIACAVEPVVINQKMQDAKV